MAMWKDPITGREHSDWGDPNAFVAHVEASKRRLEEQLLDIQARRELAEMEQKGAGR